MIARLTTFSVWLLLGGAVAYWSLQLFARPLAMPASVQPAGESRATQVDLGRLLGVVAPEAPPPEVAPSTRLRLLGVVAPKSDRAAEAGEGVALIEVDGVARTVRVGATVDGELQLLRVDARSASLGRVGQAPSQVLQITPQAAPATGSLPQAVPSPVVLGGNPNAGPGGVPNDVQQLPLRANAPSPVPVPAHPGLRPGPGPGGVPVNIQGLSPRATGPSPVPATMPSGYNAPPATAASLPVPNDGPQQQR